MTNEYWKSITVLQQCRNDENDDWVKAKAKAYTNAKVEVESERG
jgi:hypothetical protein